MATTRRVIKNNENRQFILYTDQAQTPETSYPIAARGVIQVELNEDQLLYIRQNYSNKIQIQ